MAKKPDDMIVAIVGVSAVVTLIIILIGAVPWIIEAFEISAADPHARVTAVSPSWSNQADPGTSAPRRPIS